LSENAISCSAIAGVGPQRDKSFDEPAKVVVKLPKSAV
jgi:hypothetical protein